MSDEYDITKKMLSKMRESRAASKLLKENEADTLQPSQEEVNQEQEKFKQMISPRVEFTVFNIYPQADNVVFGGKFPDGMEWQFSLEDEDGIFITANNIRMTNETVSRMQKLRGYYENWAEEWANKLATEYKGNGNF